MNYTRALLSTLGGIAAYFVLGTLFFALSPLRHEFEKYPAVYRSAEDMKRVMPIGMLAMVLSIAALAILYAIAYQGRFEGWLEGLRFGALVGAFALGSFVLHNHVNLNIGAALTIGQAVAYFVQWSVVGVVFGLVYRPLPSP